MTSLEVLADLIRQQLAVEQMPFRIALALEHLRRAETHPLINMDDE